MKAVMQYPAFLVIIPIFWSVILWTAKKLRINNKVRRNVIVFIRLLVVTLIILAMTDMSVSIRSKNVETIFLLDASDSCFANAVEVSEQIKASLKKMPEHNAAGVVVFGQDARVEQFISEDVLFAGIGTIPVRTATNIENAVKASVSLYSEDSAKRLVLITDGNQTEGSVENFANVLNAQNIETDVLKIGQDIGDEVYISDVKIPEKIQIGDKFKVQAEVKSTVKTNAIIQLYAGDKLSRQEKVVLQKGDNHFVFQDERKTEGFAAYKVVVIPDRDSITVNNEYSAFTEARAADRYLVIEGKKGESREFSKLLRAVNINCDVVLPGAAPQSVENLSLYKCVILENTGAFDLPKGFMDSIEGYVRDYGGGFIVIGGNNSFALGEYKDTVLEKILPVNMDLSQKKKIPDMCMVMVIDKSGSMQSDDGNSSKLDMAKDAASGAVDNLRDNDSVGVLSFDETFQWNVKIDKNLDKKTVKEGINGIKDGGGTSIYPAVYEAYKKICEDKSQIRHIILLTDGQDGFYSGYPELIKKLEKENITLSTVSVGTDADDKFLKSLASQGGGRYYSTKNGSDLSRIFAQEVYFARKQYIINRVFVPNIINTGSILGEEISEGLPALAGYIGTSIKDNAMSVLESDEDNDPILACMQYGLGKTVAFTSDVTNEWTGNYASWDGYPEMWKSIMTWVTDIPSMSETSLNVEEAGNKGKIVYTAKSGSNDTKIEAVCTDEAGNAEKVKLKPASPGVYEAEVSFENTGIYAVNVSMYQNGELKDSKNTRFAMQYSQEYKFVDTSAEMNDFVNKANGKFIDSLEGIFDTEPSAAISKRNLTEIFLIISIVLFFTDILNRRLEFNYSWLKIRKNRKKIGSSDMNLNEDIKESDTAKEEKPEAVEIKEKAAKKEKRKHSGKKKESEEEMLDVSALLANQKRK